MALTKNKIIAIIATIGLVTVILILALIPLYRKKNSSTTVTVTTQRNIQTETQPPSTFRNLTKTTVTISSNVETNKTMTIETMLTEIYTDPNTTTTTTSESESEIITNSSSKTTYFDTQTDTVITTKEVNIDNSVDPIASITTETSSDSGINTTVNAYSKTANFDNKTDPMITIENINTATHSESSTIISVTTTAIETGTEVSTPTTTAEILTTTSWNSETKTVADLNSQTIASNTKTDVMITTSLENPDSAVPTISRWFTLNITEKSVTKESMSWSKGLVNDITKPSEESSSSYFSTNSSHLTITDFTEPIIEKSKSVSSVTKDPSNRTTSSMFTLVIKY